MKFKLWFVSVLIALRVCADPAPYPLAINRLSVAPPALAPFQSAEFKVRITFSDGDTGLNATNCTPFLFYAASEYSASIVTAACVWVTQSLGVCDAVWSPSDLNTNGSGWMYGVGVRNASGNPIVYQHGKFSITADPYASGAGPVLWTSIIDWSKYTFQNVGHLVVAGSGLSASTNIDGSVTLTATGIAETDPIWGAVSNSVRSGAALGATALQAEADPIWSVVSNTTPRLAYWTGAVSDDVGNAANWLGGIVPNGSMAAIIDITRFPSMAFPIVGTITAKTVLCFENPLTPNIVMACNVQGDVVCRGAAGVGGLGAESKVIYGSLYCYDRSGTSPMLTVKGNVYLHDLSELAATVEGDLYVYGSSTDRSAAVKGVTKYYDTPTKTPTDRQDIYSEDGFGGRKWFWQDSTLFLDTYSNIVYASFYGGSGTGAFATATQGALADSALQSESDTLESVVARGGTVISNAVTIDSANARTNTIGGYLTKLGARVQEGISTIANASGSHSEGSDTQATNGSAHAEGGNTIAGGQYSHAEGLSTIASGTATHSAGFRAIASNNYSYVWSDGLSYGSHGTNSYNINAYGGLWMGQYRIADIDGLLYSGGNVVLTNYTETDPIALTALSQHSTNNLAHSIMARASVVATQVWDQVQYPLALTNNGDTYTIGITDATASNHPVTLRQLQEAGAIQKTYTLWPNSNCTLIAGAKTMRGSTEGTNPGGYWTNNIPSNKHYTAFCSSASGITQIKAGSTITIVADMSSTSGGGDAQSQAAEIYFRGTNGVEREITPVSGTLSQVISTRIAYIFQLITPPTNINLTADGSDSLVLKFKSSGVVSAPDLIIYGGTVSFPVSSGQYTLTTTFNAFTNTALLKSGGTMDAGAVVNFNGGAITNLSTLAAVTNRMSVIQPIDSAGLVIKNENGSTNIISVDSVTPFTTGLIGRVGIGSVAVPSNSLHIVGNLDGTNSPSKGGFLVFGVNGEDGIGISTENTLRFAINNAYAWSMTSTTISGGNYSIQLFDGPVSATAPILRYNSDNNTGYGFNGADSLALIAGGAMRLQITNNMATFNLPVTMTNNLTVLGTTTLSPNVGTYPMPYAVSNALTLANGMYQAIDLTSQGASTLYLPASPTNVTQVLYVEVNPSTNSFTLALAGLIPVTTNNGYFAPPASTVTVLECYKPFNFNGWRVRSR